MPELRRFLLRLRNALLPGRAERELTREVAAHLAILEDDYRRRGLSDADARAAARRALGAHASQDRQRDARSFMWLDDLRRDTIYALRAAGHSPMFTLVAVLTLALAIGANTAIFTVVDHVLVRSLPAPHADRLVRLYSSNPSTNSPKDDASDADLIDWRNTATSFDRLTAFAGTSETLTGAAEPEVIIAMLVDTAFLDTTGARLRLGRPFTPDDYRSAANARLGIFSTNPTVNGDASVILSEALWLRQFGGDPAVVGRRVQLNGHDAVIAGVMASGFRFNETAIGTADGWIPSVDSPQSANRRYRHLFTIGRLKAGTTVEAAQAEMSALSASLAQAHPEDDKNWTVRVEPLKDSLTSEVRPTLLILASGVVCVLLVACANIAALLLVRAAGRTREVAVRIAIGAGRGRLVRQWLTESTLLAVAGGAGGFLLAVWTVPALVAYAPKNVPRLAEIAVDGRGLIFSLALSIVTGLVCGVAPALGLGRVSTDVLRSATAIGSPRRRWLRPVLVVVQVGLAVVLLVAAGLMARSLLAVRALDLGFDPHNVLSFGVSPRSVGARSVAALIAFNHDLVGQLGALRGVVAAGSGMVPFVGGMSTGFEAEGHADQIRSQVEVSSPGYLRALGFRLRAGRFFADVDDDRGQPVAIVNQAFARTAWGDADPIGRRMRMQGPDWLTVVGVVDNTRRSNLEAAPPPIVFLPDLQTKTMISGNFVLRTTGPPADALPLVRDLVKRIDPMLAVTRVATMEERVGKFVLPRQFNLWLIGLFSLVAFVLAVVGIYGLVSELVTNRTNEIGIRLALGATRLDVIRLVVGGTLAITTAGVGLGLAGAMAVTRSLGSMIFGVEPLDPVTLVAVPAALALAACLAAAAPARRATRVDPVTALRRE
jgi:putative ABC transport system permease protein